MAAHINIGIIGMGTVGGGVVHLLTVNSAIIERRCGMELKIKSICDLAIDKISERLPGVTYTANWKDITGDPEISIVVELIGGLEPAKSIHLEALKNGKSVVTANKKLLAEEGREIFERAESTGKYMGFEASVGGGIPCILSMKKGMVGNSILSISGILNGTTNYILTKMEESGMSFENALRLAQEKGFAEADPTFDVEGYDAAHKISILSMLAYNRRIEYKSVPVEGITRISALDIRFAREMGYVIKLLGISRTVGDEIDIRVHPAMLHRTHPLASVRNENNAIMFVGDMTGPVTLHGRGAGAHPTASAVVSDIVQAAESATGRVLPPIATKEARYLPPQKRLSRYYIRVQTLDNPGILSKISGVLGRHDISISSVIQKEANTEFVPLLFMTHEAYEEGMINALEEINNFDFADGKAMMIRVEDPENQGGRNE